MRAFRAILGSTLIIGIAACSSGSRAPSPEAVTLPPTGGAQPSHAKALLYFEGSVDVTQRTMTVVAKTPSGALKAQATLPYGTGAGEVYFHTCPGTVSYTSTGLGGGTLSASVQAVNDMAAAIPDFTVNITSISDTGTVFTTSLGPGNDYGNVPNTGDTSCSPNVATWTFTQASTTSFTFTGEVDGTAPSGCQSKGQCMVFIGTNATAGDLGGLAGADATCQTEAAGLGLAGTFKAWLSDDSGNCPNTRFVQATVPYVSFETGKTIANDYAGLISGTHLNPVENGGYNAWTGTAPDGTALVGFTCSGFTSSATGSGQAGVTNVADSNWTQQLGDIQACNTPPSANIVSSPYCFEQ